MEHKLSRLYRGYEGNKDFFEASPVILTDNVGEFTRVDNIKFDVREESKLLLFCASIVLTRKDILRKATPSFGIICLKELLLLT